MSDVKKDVGKRLREAREKRGLRQNRVAKSLGIHNSTLAKYESGEREADNETLSKLSEIYEVSPTWILTGEHDNTLFNNDQARNDVINAYNRLPHSKKKIVDELIHALLNE